MPKSFCVLGVGSGDGKHDIKILRVVVRGLRSTHGEHQKPSMLAVTNEDDGSSIEACESRKSHGKIGDCEQCTVKCETNNSLIQLVIVDVL